MVRVENVIKDYGKSRVLQGISFHVARGEIFALLGPNGAGKTTTLKAIMGLLRPTEGHIWVDNLEVRQFPREVRSKIGFLPQRVSFSGNLRVQDVLAFYASLRGASREEVDRVLELVGLVSDADKRVSTLSGGMLQRLGLAQALLNDPPLLIFDEPTLSLDPQGIAQFKRLLLRLNAQGKTILLSSHILSDVEEVAHRAAILLDGRLQAVGSLEELKARFPFREYFWVTLKDSLNKALEFLASLGYRAELNGKALRIYSSERIEVLQELSKAGFQVLDIKTKEVTLEEVFMKYMEGE